MNTYVIGYDLNRPRGPNDYPDLMEQIKGLGAWWHNLDSTWVVKSSLSAFSIVEHLKHFIDSGDELLVAEITRNTAWIGFNQTASDWLKKSL